MKWHFLSLPLCRGCSIRPEDFPSSPKFLSLSEVPAQHPALGALAKPRLDSMPPEVFASLVHPVISQGHHSFHCSSAQIQLLSAVTGLCSQFMATNNPLQTDKLFQLSKHSIIAEHIFPRLCGKWQSSVIVSVSCNATDIPVH